MTIELALSPDAEAHLRARAAATGKELPEFVREMIEEKLAVTTPPAPHGQSSLEAFRAAMDAMEERARSRADRYPPGWVLDDSRESIYEDRW